MCSSLTASMSSDYYLCLVLQRSMIAPLDSQLYSRTCKLDPLSQDRHVLLHSMNNSGDDVFKAAAFLTEALTDPSAMNSNEPTDAPFKRGLRTDAPFFTWLEYPENAHRLKRYAVAMNGVKNITVPGAIYQGMFSLFIKWLRAGILSRLNPTSADFDWKGLPKNSVVVDVGGGIGSLSLTLAEGYSHLKFVVQDREAVVTGSAQKVSR